MKCKPQCENIDSSHVQDNTLCTRSGGGGIVQLFIENGGIFKILIIFFGYL